MLLVLLQGPSSTVQRELIMMILRILGTHHEIRERKSKFSEGRKPVVGLRGRLHPANKFPWKLFYLSSYNSTGPCFSNRMIIWKSNASA